MEKIASAGTSKSGKAVNLARPVRAKRRSEPATSDPKSFTSGYTDIRELLLSLATEESAGAPVIIEDEDEDAESSAEDEVDQASTKTVNDANNDPDDYQKSLKTFGNKMAATSAGRTAGWIKSLDPLPHSSLKRKATRSLSPARSTHRLHFDTGSLLFVPKDEVTPNETPRYSDQTHTPATPAADDNYLEPSPSPSPYPRDEAVTAGKEVTKAHKDTHRAHLETIEARKAEKHIAAESTRKDTGTAREAQEKSNAKSTPDQTAMVNIALFVNAINATHPTHPENTATNPPRSGNAAEKFSVVATQMLNRQRTFVESFETWERETYDPGAYDTASTRALRTFIHGLRGGVDEMQGYADDFDTL
ncbi:hypothetical protein D6D20_08919 [Aureobasidium pullulans]|uniref:Uncharacterized protein n=1 Tax=Aureobasidium pullulans TaxID=5580 RepID=A0A4S8YND7_AURPU|nr:hypothetical protein D6D20_08919 [Aureobasidium pullulans]